MFYQFQESQRDYFPNDTVRGRSLVSSAVYYEVAPHVVQMKCDIAFGIRRVTRLSESEILHLWTRFIEPENDSIVAEHGLSSKSRRPRSRSSDTSVGISAGKKASQRLWMFKVKEEQNDSWNEEPCRDVHQVGDEREVEVMRSFNWHPRELITDDGVLPERGYSQFNDVSSGYLDTLYRKSPSPAFGWCSVFRMFGGTERLER
ncbi:hypothetical protein Tco_1485610 [Tanacetum coccineum]